MSLNQNQVNGMVQGILDLGLPLSEQDVRSALKQFNYNQESATNYLIECVSNQQN